MNYSKALLLVLLFVMLSITASAQVPQFKVIDYISMIRNNKLALTWNPDNKVFEGFLPEEKTLAGIASDVILLEKHKTELTKAKEELVARGLLASVVSDDSSDWNKLYELDLELEKTEKTIEQYKFSIESGLMPDSQPAIDGLKKILSEVRNEYSQLPGTSSGTIFINLLPAEILPPPPARLGKAGLFKFYTSLDSNDLKVFLEHKNTISTLFNCTRLPVLYQKEGEN